MNFGAKYPYKIRFEGQIWRFWTATLLSYGILGLAGSIAINATFGLVLEHIIKAKNMIILYLISTFGTNLIGCLGSDNIGVARNGPLTSFIGCFLAFFLINWDELAPFEKYRSKFPFLLSMIIIMVILLDFFKNGDPWGDLGGAISGFLLGLVLIHPILEGEKKRKIKIYGGLCLFGFLSISLICFFAISNPEPLNF